MTASNNNHFSVENQFLVSMPQLDDPNFRQTVVLICKHNSEGAMGVIINRVSDQTAGDIYSHLKIEVSDLRHGAAPVYEGGPVQPEIGFIVHDAPLQNWESSLDIGGGLRLTSSMDILKDMARGRGPENALMILGYSGWAPGQLEYEIQKNSWFTVPVNHNILFAAQADEKWQMSARILGIDIHQLSSRAGHA